MGTSSIDEGVPVSDDLRTVATSNEDAFRCLLAIYARPGQIISDVTYGRGRFWRLVDAGRYDTKRTDLKDGIDFRDLPYADASIDVLVLDPPYRYTPAKHVAHEESGNHGEVDAVYNLKGSAPTSTKGVIKLYRDGMREAARVLKEGGIALVKCQDTIQDGKQWWVHVELMGVAEGLGFACKDLMVVTPATVIKTRWPMQRHLRKAHSYFLVLRNGGHFLCGIPKMCSR